MMEKFAAAAITVGAAATTGAVASDQYYQIALWMPIAIGVICALLVRALTAMTTIKKETLLYNILVSVLTSIMTAVIVNDQHLGALSAMMLGITIGGLGIGAIKLAKPFTLSLLSKLQETLANPPKSDEDEEDPKP